MNLESISRAIQKSIEKENPFYFLQIVSLKFQDGKILDKELDGYFDRYNFHLRTVEDKKVAMYLALLDTYNIILYRGTKIENEPSKKLLLKN